MLIHYNNFTKHKGFSRQSDIFQYFCALFYISESCFLHINHVPGHFGVGAK